jgi:cytochrome c oxidase assembly protein subunit 15
MRHSFAGLAIPTFPLTPEGGLVPAQWSFAVSINFAHRLMALVLAVALPWLAVMVWRDPAAGSGLRRLAGAMVALLGAQILLGASIVWTGRNPYSTTAHVLVGALALATTFLLTWVAHRDKLETGAPRPAADRPASAAPADADRRLPAHA